MLYITRKSLELDTPLKRNHIVWEDHDSRNENKQPLEGEMTRRQVQPTLSVS